MIQRLWRNSSGYNLVIVKVAKVEEVEETRKEIEDRLNKKEQVALILKSYLFAPSSILYLV